MRDLRQRDALRDEQIAEALGLHRNSVARIRQRFLQLGEAPALNRQPRCQPPVAAFIGWGETSPTDSNLLLDTSRWT